MTITDRNHPPTEPATRPVMNPQVRTAIAAGALLACLLVGAGIIYWLLFASSPKRRVVQVDPAQQTAARLRPRFPIGPQRTDRPGIHRVGDEWIVRGSNGEMRLRTSAAGAGAGAGDVSYRFPAGMKLTPEENALLAGRYRILHDELMAREWKVTADQTARLNSLDVGSSQMNPSAQQREELWRLWTAFDRASTGQGKIDAQKKLIERLDQIGQSLFAPARQQYTTRVDQIKTILTAEQVRAITGQ